MPDHDTHRGASLGLPAAAGAAGSWPDAARPGAAFLCQLIAERQHLPPQRLRRRAPPAVATGAYLATAEHAVRRLPPGYRKSLSV